MENQEQKNEALVGGSGLNAGLCQTCNGNDRDMPCAYPSKGGTGCLRDKRILAERKARNEIWIPAIHGTGPLSGDY